MIIEMAREEPSLDQALGDLEQIVGRLEEGKLSLEDSLALFEKGIRLVRLCSSRLKSAEQKIERLTSELIEDKA